MRTVVSTGDRVPDAVHSSLNRLVDRLASRPGLHHVSLAVASSDGRRHWAGTSAPTGRGDPELSPETPFFVASITKRFIIALVLQAHERAELDLDAPITRYLPSSVTTGLHVRGGVDRTSRITPRHLASHTSGLPDFFERRRGGPSIYRQLRAGEDTSWTFADILDITREQQRPHFDPQNLDARRQRARYSDTGFQLLIRILETVTSKAYPLLLTERIIDPLGLTRTWHPAAEPAVSDLPTPLPLYAGRRRVDVPSVIRSSNDLFSTTADLLNFERALVTGQLFREPSTCRSLTERRNRLRNAPALRYGLGTMVFSVNRLVSPRGAPVSLVGHSGSTGSWLFSCPELDLQLAGTVDQTEARAVPFRIMAGCLRIWADQ